LRFLYLGMFNLQAIIRVSSIDEERKVLLLASFSKH